MKAIYTIDSKSIQSYNPTHEQFVKVAKLWPVYIYIHYVRRSKITRR